ncbi:hypothetical protein EYF80_016669 [Liparis tanakae]|uniref:Uncharacterized protein n=1 Tax=Liparis tanakae TaxID=230148 RepID=A0A4Z2I7N1_9TELE|nr:hypothetical protein EYF80_016669 [Liparis tanakae]
MELAVTNGAVRSIICILISGTESGRRAHGSPTYPPAALPPALPLPPTGVVLIDVEYENIRDGGGEECDLQIEKIMTLIGAGIDFSRDQQYATPAQGGRPRDGFCFRFLEVDLNASQGLCQSE